MSSGDVRVLRREPGQESPRMPAWKREILERRKAKGSGAAAAGASDAAPSPSGAASRLNGEVEVAPGENGASASKEAAGAARNYTVTTAGQHFAVKRGSSSAAASPELSPVKTKKEPWTEERERLVLQDSLGPLQENPFIKLERERRRRQEREGAARPVQHILELYGSVPGIRTIRADNIIIIESDPDYFPEGGGGGGGGKAGSRGQQNGTVSSYSSLNDLIDRRGSGVTEIRAKEVVIYDSSLSKSEENLSTLGRPGPDGSGGPVEGQGRVSRMLQKFDRNFGKLQPKSRSTENLLDLDGGPIRPRPWAPQQRSHPVPKPAGSPERSRSAAVFQSSGSSEADELGRGSPQPAGSPQSVSSFRRRFEVCGGPGPEEADGPRAGTPRERDAEGPSKPKVPCSPEKRCYRAESPASCSPPDSPPSPGFEFRPSPRPDLSALPAGDIQARALANLRLQSRNSFMVIPRRRGPVASPGNTAPSSPVRSPPSPTPLLSMEEVTPVPIPATPPPTPPVSKKLEGERAIRQAKVEPPEADPPAGVEPPASPLPPLRGMPESPATEHLPVTNIDDVEVGPPRPALSPVVQRRSGNTFTVVPKRKQEPQPNSPEPQEPTSGTPGTSTPPGAPYSQLGSLLKKRYPAVEEIEVIGGYLSLGRSCLSKTGSTGKKLKISFNETSLSSTFEYPSESSLWGDEDDEDDEEEGEEAKVEHAAVPRSSYTSSPTQTTSSGTDLSNYTPKHSVDFSVWQERKMDEAVFPGDSDSRQTESSTEDVMLTPADSASLSDFSSEPALYF
ncbi:taperin isoform X2 [Scleropages formosus]|uniref:taperin isoform X2 n=1 Tax=Scleropages formosus TaxID=113540 RepID=UPI0010FAA9EC|nr:taperin isoform X2 [Scleropages formosus]